MWGRGARGANERFTALRRGVSGARGGSGRRAAPREGSLAELAELERQYEQTNCRIERGLLRHQRDRAIRHDGAARGHGLIGMRERAQLVGGTLEAGPALARAQADALAQGVAQVDIEAGQLALGDQILERLERQIRVDGGGTEADEQRDVVDLAGIAGLHDEGDPRPLLGADQVVVHRRGQK